MDASLALTLTHMQAHTQDSMHREWSTALDTHALQPPTARPAQPYALYVASLARRSTQPPVCTIHVATMPGYVADDDTLERYTPAREPDLTWNAGDGTLMLAWTTNDEEWSRTVVAGIREAKEEFHLD